MRRSDQVSLKKHPWLPANAALLLVVGAQAFAALGCDQNSGGAAVVPIGGGGDGGGGGAGGASGGAGGASVAFDGCDETQVWPSVNGTAMTSYSHKIWDGAQRVLSEESSTTPSFSGRVRLAWRYGDDGRVIAYAGFARDAFDTYGNFQYDNAYDDHDNPTDLRFSNPSQPDVTVPSPATITSGIAYANTYVADRLSSSTRTPYGGFGSEGVEQLVFHEDGVGRCDRVETNAAAGTPLWVETRTYDDAGRLSRVDTRPADPSAPSRCPLPTEVNTLTSTETSPTSRPGVAAISRANRTFGNTRRSRPTVRNASNISISRSTTYPTMSSLAPTEPRASSPTTF